MKKNTFIKIYEIFIKNLYLLCDYFKTCLWRESVLKLLSVRLVKTVKQLMICERKMLEINQEFSEMKIKPRILIVDDEPQIGRVLRISLVAQGYSIRVATDGISAMEIFSAWQTDLVITDLSMPAMDGLELCRKLRAESQIPIIVLTVGGKEHTRSEALAAGADEYLVKPFGINELLTRVRSLLAPL
jgi:CheY-like chemotaxis protein